MKRFAIATTLLLAAASSADAQIVNGGFELPSCPTICINTPITGWTNYGSVDQIGSLWQAASGTTSVDLNGDFRGGIGQVVTGLTAGTTYNLSFMMSKNPVLATANLDVLWLAVDPAANFFTAPSGTLFTFSAANTSSNMLWAARTGSFLATGSSMFLGFRSLEFSTANDIRAGAALDAVALSPLVTSTVPEPSTVMLLSGGLLLLSTVTRRRRSRSARTA